MDANSLFVMNAGTIAFYTHFTSTYYRYLWVRVCLLVGQFPLLQVTGVDYFQKSWIYFKRLQN